MNFLEELMIKQKVSAAIGRIAKENGTTSENFEVKIVGGPKNQFKIELHISGQYKKDLTLSDLLK